jgi:hypothetical protein
MLSILLALMLPLDPQAQYMRFQGCLGDNVTVCSQVVSLVWPYKTPKSYIARCVAVDNSKILVEVVKKVDGKNFIISEVNATGKLQTVTISCETVSIPLKRVAK